MAAIDNITELAQDTFYTINGSENDDTGDDLTTFQNNFIRGFNLWLDELDYEAYWNRLRIDDLILSTVSDTTTYSFDLPEEYRTPIFSTNKYLKFVIDGTVVARFKLVDPNQRVVDDDIYHADRATFVEESKIVLSRAPREEELGASIVLDVVQYFPKLTRTDDTVLGLIPNKNLAVLGVAKSNTLADVTKVTLSPSFVQRYANELSKAIAANNASNEIDDMWTEDYSYIGGIY